MQRKSKALGKRSFRASIVCNCVMCYLCMCMCNVYVVHHALRVLKPGGVLQHNWIVYSPQRGGKGDDKLNIHPNFWGGRWKSSGLGWGKRWHRDIAAERREGVEVLPACAGSMGASVDADSIEIFTNEYGPTNGYSVRLVKRGVRSMSPEVSARNSRLRSSTTFW